MDETDFGIQAERQGARGRYVMALPDSEPAELTFVEAAPDHMVIDNSWVPSRHRGRGVALKLVKKAVEDARATNVLITPICRYVAAEFRHHPEWADVLKR